MMYFYLTNHDTHFCWITGCTLVHFGSEKNSSECIKSVSKINSSKTRRQLTIKKCKAMNY